MQTPVILIVEDEDVTRLNLVSLFEAEGYKVIEAIDGDDMHDKLTNNDDVNLVVMDINLPGKNGLILARELRQKRKVGLIFLTGRDNDVDRILGLEIGADDYITKPFNPRELTIRARNLITRTALGGEESAIDARTSDAIALAIRYACPIFTYEDILARAGIIVNSTKEEEDLLLEEEEDKLAEDDGITSYSIEKLERLLEKAIEKEDYEKASEIRDEITRRKTN